MNLDDQMEGEVGELGAGRDEFLDGLGSDDQVDSEVGELEAGRDVLNKGDPGHEDERAENG